MSSKEDINEYLKRLKNGEPCIEEFFNAVSGHIRCIAYKYLIDKWYVNDVVTIVFKKVLDNIQYFDELQNGKAWIYKIAQNEAYTINLQEKKHRHASLDEVSEEVACTNDDYDGLEFVSALHNALGKLDETDREIVELRIFKGMIFQEIADRLGMYVGTVYKKFKRAAKQILDDIS